MFKDSKKKKKRIFWPSRTSAKRKSSSNPELRAKFEDTKETKRLNIVKTANKNESQRIKIAIPDTSQDTVETQKLTIATTADKTESQRIGLEIDDKSEDNIETLARNIRIMKKKQNSGSADSGAFNRRKASRRLTNIKTGVWIYREDGSVLDSGEAVVRDLSSTGARITDLKLHSGALPVNPFVLYLTMHVSQKGDVGVICKPVRFTHDGYGVRFEDFQVTV